MEIRLYNTLTRKKESFKPIHKNQVGIYTCGPTVYWYAHIGNFRTYIFADTLKRILEYNNYHVRQVINITDVGHLTSDADEGEDRLEQAATKEGKTAQDIANYYFNIFHEDRKKLFLEEPEVWCKATEHIKEQITMIQTLEKKGHTYTTKDGIYFDTTTFPNYGKLSNKKPETLKTGKRISMKEKKNNTDFALWKFSEKPGIRQQEWNSPWGLGFPGWHIECSAMSNKYLGAPFDIHTGGEDHMHIHHENEIAQSEAALNKQPWVHYWMHAAFLNLKEEKMSKSKGNIQTITELEQEGINPLAYKYFTYTAHYRKPLTWNKEAITSAQNSYNRIKEIINKLPEEEKENKTYIKKFEEAINDDLDMPKALAVLWELLRDEQAKGKKATIKKMDEVLALQLLQQENITIPKEIQQLAKEREEARKNKEWKKSDELRKTINNKGWTIKDEKEGYTIHYG